jgi:hypothetical protein
LDIVKEALRVFFVIGIVLIPILYWISGKAMGRNQSRTRNEDEHARRSDEHSLSRSA